MPALPSPVRALMFQLRIIFTELESRLPDDDAPISVLIQYGRQYLVEMGICADKLAEEVDMEAAAGGAEDNVEELRAELQRTQWAACIWELALIMLVMRPLVAGEMLLHWWHRHLCDPAAEAVADRLATALAPETVSYYWDTLGSLITQGKPDAARSLLACHTQLHAAAGGAGLASPGAALLLRLDLLLDTIPRLSEKEVLAPHHEAAPPSLAAQESLSAFRFQWRVWKEDASQLHTDATHAASTGDTSAAGVAATAAILCADPHALASACGGAWHGLLMARLFLDQPTRLRWELVGAMAGDAGSGVIEGNDIFSSCLVALLSDDPYAAVKCIRTAYGDGWLTAHLWDLLCRARAVPADDTVDGSPLSLRHFFLLQYARALAGRESLWQLAAAYGTGLLVHPSAAAETQVWLREMLAAEASSAAASAHPGGRLHAVKLRKLLRVCEAHGIDPGPILDARGGAGGRGVARGDAAVRAELRLPDAAGVRAWELQAMAIRALDQAIGCEQGEGADAGGGSADTGGGDADAGGGDAIADLRARVRTDGVAGPFYFRGPAWLPPLVELLELLFRLRATGGKADPADVDGLRILATSLCSTTPDGGADAEAHLVLTRRILRFLCAGGPSPLLSPYCLSGHKQQGNPPALRLHAADAYALLAQHEILRASALADKPPAPLLDSRPHEVGGEEAARAGTLSHALAAAILSDAEAATAQTCWGIGC